MSYTDSEATMARLSSRPDIQSTLILSRPSGTIIKVTGKLANADADAANSESGAIGARQQPRNGLHGVATSKLPGDNRELTDEEQAAPKITEAERCAQVVWRFVRASKDCVEELSQDVRPRS